jgi:hypothetical protein
MEIQKHFDRLLKYAIPQPCQSSWNTPLLPVQKLGTEDFRPVQDLQTINLATVTLYPIVPNPYKLLGLVPAEAKFFPAYILRMHFCASSSPTEPTYFSLPVGKSQYWRKGASNLDSIATGFQKFTHYFWNCLGIQLHSFLSQPHGCTLLQYVDDFLLAGPTWEDCMEGTCFLLSVLWEAGYKIFQKKAQICQTPSNTLDFTCHKDSTGLALRGNRLFVPFQPPTHWQIKEYLGAEGFC